MSRLSRRVVLSCATLLFVGPSLVAREEAEGTGEAKVRLLSEALTARDRGDLDAARAKLHELQKLAPNDPTVARLLSSLDRVTRKTVTVRGGVVADRAAASDAEAFAREEENRLATEVESGRAAVRDARSLAAAGEFAAALDRLSRARAAVRENPLTEVVLAEIGVAAVEISKARDDQAARAEGELTPTRELEAALPRAAEATSPRSPSDPSSREKRGEQGDVSMQTAALAPRSAATVSAPDILALIARGRAQFLAGEPAAAGQTFASVLEVDPQNAVARDFLRRIAGGSVDRNVDRVQTGAQLLNEVERAWQRPRVFKEPPPSAVPGTDESPVWKKLNEIVLPGVNFSGMELSRVVTTLSVVSEEFDPSGMVPKGVNIVLVDPAQANPVVNLTLRNLSLKRVLDFVTDSVGYQYEVQKDAVVVRPGGEKSALETQFYPVSRSTVLRMTGRGAPAAVGGVSDGAAGGASASVPGGPLAVAGEGQAIRSFLQLAGVSFEATAGSTLAFDGSQLIVTQTARNLERIRNILARYADVRQVEIEAKFMEVQDGTLEELGVNWSVATKAGLADPRLQSRYVVGNRSLEDAFKNATTSQEIQITGQEPISVSAPALPGTVNLGVNSPPLATLAGIFGEFNVQAIVRALAQKSGTELLSAPKLTVLSGNQATITVAQELRYPQSYGQVQSQVGTGSASGGGSAGVSITAGTPQDFTTRNIGVELKVTPTVEEDDYSISLDLNPKVTEFEGFVEYGGPSVAISQGTTVTVPPGFYQPIFAVRELTTKVTIWDGATLVMGGLTREDTRKTNDKVPVLGNVPVLGRLFRSSGESAQKRNLLIFVTANLVSPGGALKNQVMPGVSTGTIFQNPTIVTPAGATGRQGKK